MYYKPYKRRILRVFDKYGVSNRNANGIIQKYASQIDSYLLLLYSKYFLNINIETVFSLGIIVEKLETKYNFSKEKLEGLYKIEGKELNILLIEIIDKLEFGDSGIFKLRNEIKWCKFDEISKSNPELKLKKESLFNKYVGQEESLFDILNIKYNSQIKSKSNSKKLQQKQAQEKEEAEKIILSQKQAQDKEEAEAEAEKIMLLQKQAQEKEEAEKIILSQKQAQDKQEAEAKKNVLLQKQAQEKEEAEKIILSQKQAQDKEEAEAEKIVLLQKQAQEKEEAEKILLSQKQAQVKEEAEAEKIMLLQKQAQEKEDVKKDSPIKNGSFGKTLLWKGIMVPVVLAPNEKTARTFAQLNLNKLPNYLDKSKFIFVWNKKVRFIDLSKESNSGSEKRQKKKVKIVLLFAILAILSATFVYLFFDNDLPTKNNLLVNNKVDSLKQTNDGESASDQENTTPNAVNKVNSHEKLEDEDFHVNNEDTSKTNNQVTNLKISFAPNKIDSIITEEKFNDTIIQIISNNNIYVPDETYLEEQRSTLNTKYHIILGCYDVKRNAKNELDRITSEGIAEGNLIKRKDKYFVIRHSFETSAEGYSSLKQLRNEGVDCWLLKGEFNYLTTAEGKYEDESKKSLFDKYHVIVGCFDIKQNAKNQLVRVASDGINDASIIEIGNRYFVAIKSFSSSKKGYKSIKGLRLQGLDCWLLNHKVKLE